LWIKWRLHKSPSQIRSYKSRIIRDRRSRDGANWAPSEFRRARRRQERFSRPLSRATVTSPLPPFPSRPYGELASVDEAHRGFRGGFVYICIPRIAESPNRRNPSDHSFLRRKLSSPAGGGGGRGGHGDPSRGLQLAGPTWPIAMLRLERNSRRLECNAVCINVGRERASIRPRQHNRYAKSTHGRP